METSKKGLNYYPFGLEQNDRSYQSNSYRYGFNGKEKDSGGEWGSQTHYDYGFRIYNPSIARFLSVDPLSGNYPWFTPYQFAGNTPIWAIDIEGLEAFYVTRWYENDQLNTKIKVEVLSADERPENSGRMFLRGPHKDQNHFIQHTLIDRDGNATTTYAPALSSDEYKAMRAETDKGRMGNELLPGLYVAEYSEYSPSPPPPKPKVTISEPVVKEALVNPNVVIPNIKSKPPPVIETGEILFVGNSNNLVGGDEEIDNVYSILIDNPDLRVTIVGNVGTNFKTRSSKNPIDYFRDRDVIFGSSNDALNQKSVGTYKNVDTGEEFKGTLRDLMLLRANKIKKELEDRGINPDRVDVAPGSVEFGEENRTTEFRFDKG